MLRTALAVSIAAAAASLIVGFAVSLLMIPEMLPIYADDLVMLLGATVMIAMLGLPHSLPGIATTSGICFLLVLHGRIRWWSAMIAGLIGGGIYAVGIAPLFKGYSLCVVVGGTIAGLIAYLHLRTEPVIHKSSLRIPADSETP